MKLFGKRAVTERLNAAPQTIRTVYIKEQPQPHELVPLLRQKNIRLIMVGEREFSTLAGTHHTQGVIAEVAEFRYAELDELWAGGVTPTLVALSNITDPQNLGSIIRTAACFGGFAVIIPEHRSAEINETVLKVACGGENYVPVAKVKNLIPALEQAKKAGYWVAGTCVDGKEVLGEFSFPQPVCLVIGAEDKGIRPGVSRHLDVTVRLSMPHAALSFNAAVATAIFCYEIFQQKKSAAR